MRYVWHKGEWVEAWVGQALTEPCLPTPGIITDDMVPACHPVSGVVVDSKSAFRRMTKDAGCVELGNDAAQVVAQRPEPDRTIRQDIHKAWQKLAEGYKPQSLERAEGRERRYG